MLLEIVYKIIAIILHLRLLPIEESLDHEPQCRFRPGRGCINGQHRHKNSHQKT